MKRNSNINNTNNFNTKNTSAINGIITGQLMKLFEDEIRELISTEKELTKVIPVFIKNTTSIKLIESLTENLTQSNLHVGRLAKVFGLINRKIGAQKCDLTSTLCDENILKIKATTTTGVGDETIIAAFHKVKYHEISSYNTLIKYAKALNLKDVVALLAMILIEVMRSNLHLSKLEINLINQEITDLPN